MHFIEQIIEPQKFATWFKPVRPVSIVDSTLTVEVPSDFFREYLEEEFLDIIKKALNEHLDIPEDSVTLESTFEDLKIDSLDLVELIVSLEDEMGIEFGEPEGLATVGDVVAYVETLK